jgi:hypothetical protein
MTVVVNRDGCPAREPGQLGRPLHRPTASVILHGKGPADDSGRTGIVLKEPDNDWIAVRPDRDADQVQVLSARIRKGHVPQNGAGPPVIFDRSPDTANERESLLIGREAGHHRMTIGADRDTTSPPLN